MDFDLNTLSVYLFYKKEIAIENHNGKDTEMFASNSF